MVITDRALCWLDTNYSNVIGPEIAPIFLLAQSAGKPLSSTENCLAYLFVVPGSRIRVDCTICNVPTSFILNWWSPNVGVFCPFLFDRFSGILQKYDLNNPAISSGFEMSLVFRYYNIFVLDKVLQFSFIQHFRN